ncbi:MAG: anti-sigma factor family protein [Candidatus Binatia bacterium]
MTCAEYRHWVAADVDDLLGDQADGVRRHLAACDSCRRSRERQLAVRDLLRARSFLEPAPESLRGRLVERLERESGGAPERSRWLSARWVGLALAGATAALVIILSNRTASFAPLIESYDLASGGALELALRTSSLAELETYFRERRGEGIRDHVVDLSAAGFRLIGGTLANLANRKARLAVYSDGTNWIICDYQLAERFPIALPANGAPVFFSQGGVNFCARRMGDEVCLLATRMAMDLFRRTLGAA